MGSILKFMVGIGLLVIAYWHASNGSAYHLFVFWGFVVVVVGLMIYGWWERTH